MSKTISSPYTTYFLCYCPQCEEEYSHAMIFEELDDLKCDICKTEIIYSRYHIDISKLPFIIHDSKLSNEKGLSHHCILEELKELDLTIYLQKKYDNLNTIDKLINAKFAIKCKHCMNN